MKNILLLLLIAFSADVFAQGSDPNMGIIPAPVSVKKDKGEFKLTPETIIFCDSPDTRAVHFLTDYLKKEGFVFSVTDISLVDKKQRNL